MKLIRVLSYFCVILICIGGGYFVIYRPFSNKIPRGITNAQKLEKKWETYLQHAQMLSYLHDYIKAESEYRMLLELKPNSIIVKVNLAKILYYQGKYEEALILLKQIPADQKDEKIKLLIADIDIALGRYEEAEFFFNEYLQQFPENQSIQLKLAQVLTWQKKYEKTIELYQNLLVHDPQNIQLRRQYALVLIWMGRLNEGEEELKKTLTSERNIP